MVLFKEVFTEKQTELKGEVKDLSDKVNEIDRNLLDFKKGNESDFRNKKSYSRSIDKVFFNCIYHFISNNNWHQSYGVEEVLNYANYRAKISYCFG